jgi:hypothetical protein
MMITQRDIQVVDFLETYKAATSSTLIQLFYPSVSVGCRRLTALTTAGAVKRERGNVSIQYIYYIKRPAQLRHCVALTTFYAGFCKQYKVVHFKKEPTIGNIRPDAMIGYIDNDVEAVAFVEVELSNKGIDIAKYKAFEQLGCKKYFDTMPKIIVVTDKNYETCDKYEVWKI